jgi:Na+/H+-dicarboxylate symporter
VEIPHPIEVIYPRSLKHLADQVQSMVAGRLWLKVVLGMIAGIGIGVALGPTANLVEPETARLISRWIGLPGTLFLGTIQMIVIPLVFASIVRGLAASESVEQLKKTGLRAVVLFVSTTTTAISIGVGLALLVRPGRLLDAEAARALSQTDAAPSPEAAAVTVDSLPLAIAGLIPINPLGAMVESEMLGVVVFAIFIGIALVSLPPAQSSPLLTLLGSLQSVSLTVVRWAMKLAPWAVLGLMAQLLSRLGLGALVGMSAYVATVLGGLLLLLVVYLILAAVLGRTSPIRFLKAAREAQLLAFSTSSSAAVMPLSMKTAEEKLGVRPSVSQFIIPLGATINMDGTALYQGVATIFLAQAFGLDLGVGELALVVVTAVGASIGTPSTPGVGIVILATVLTSVGVPVAGVGLIIGVDRILDMSRTALNVTGDLVASLVIDRFSAATPADEQLAREAERESTRAAEGVDVVITEED